MLSAVIVIKPSSQNLCSKLPLIVQLFCCKGRQEQNLHFNNCRAISVYMNPIRQHYAAKSGNAAQLQDVIYKSFNCPNYWAWSKKSAKFLKNQSELGAFLVSVNCPFGLCPGAVLLF
jgi:hypothetical protein